MKNPLPKQWRWLLAFLLFMTSHAAQATIYYTANGVANANWNSPGSWTLNATGGGFTLASSGLITAGPGSGQGNGTAVDSVVILEGATIVMNTATVRTIAYLEIRSGGRLIITTNTAHNLGVVVGQGTLRFTVNPTAITATNATAFMSAVGGTVELAGASHTVNNTLFGQTYNNLTLSGGTANNKTITGLVTKGTLKVDSLATLLIDNAAARTISIGNDFTVTSTLGAGQFAVNSSAAGNFEHNITVGGNASFSGAATVNLTQGAANQYRANLNFTAANKNQTLALNCSTRVYRLVVDKGTDATYELHVFADATNRLVITGPTNDCGGTTGADLPTTCNNGLALRAGILRLGANINLAMAISNNYNIDFDAELQIDGATLTLTGGTALVPYGVVRVKSGTLNATMADGIAVRYGGQWITEGGITNVNGFRIATVGGVNNKPTVRVTGGTINLATNGSATANMSLNDVNSVFQMSGGQINIINDASRNFWNVTSAVENISVTGGLVRVRTSSSAGTIIANNPFWDLEVVRYGNNNTVSAASAISVLNDLTIIDSTAGAANVLSMGANNLSVGRNFVINAGAEFLPGTGTAGLTFTGRNGSRFENGNTTGTIALQNLTIDKDADTSTVRFVSTGRATNSVFASVAQTLSVVRGRIEYNAFELAVTGSVSVTSSNTRIGGSTAAGRLHLSSASAQTITVPASASFRIGRLRVSGGGLKTLSGSSIDTLNVLQLAGAIFDIGLNGVMVQDSLVAATAFSATNHIRTSGDAGNSSLIRYIGADGTYTWPLGTFESAATRYRPVTATFSGVSAAANRGYLAISFDIDRYAGLGGADPNALQAHWFTRVVSGFTTPPTVRYTFQSVAIDWPSGTVNDPNTWFPGEVNLSTAARSWQNGAGASIDGTGLLTLPTAGLPVRNAMFAAGTGTASGDAFFGSVSRYWYRDAAADGDAQDGQPWSNNTIWSTDATNTYDGAACGCTPVAGSIIYLSRDPDVADRAGAHWLYTEGVGANLPPALAGVVFEDRGGTGWAPRITVRQTSGNVNLGLLRKVSTTFTTEFFVEGQPGTPDVIPTLVGTDFTEYNSSVNARFNFRVMGAGELNVLASNGFPTIYPELRIEGNGNNTDRFVVFEDNINVNESILLDFGGGLRLHDGTNGDITVAEGVRVGAPGGGEYGRIEFKASGTVARKLEILGTFQNVAANPGLQISGTNSVFTVDNATNGTAGAPAHQLIVQRGITLLAGTATLDLFSNAATDPRHVDLYLKGTRSAVFTNSGSTTPQFNRIIMDKELADSTFRINSNFTISTAAAGATATKPVELKTGVLILNPTSTFVTLNLTTGTTDFNIPSTAGLSLLNNVRAVVSNTGTDAFGINLDGSLMLRGTATLTMSGGNGVVSNITYSASGKSTLDFGGGNVYIDGGIRRSALSSGGVLRYRQSSGTIYLGDSITTVAQTMVPTNRGIFDIENNSGSTFSMLGGTMVIVRQRTTGTFPEFYMNLVVPDDSMAVGAQLQLGTAAVTNPTGVGVNVAATPVAQNSIRVQSRIVGGLNVVAGAGALVGNQQVNNLTVRGNVTINNNTTFTTGALNLTVRGNFTNAGTYTSTGTTIFGSPTANQTVTATANTTFGNLQINNTFTGGTVTLAGAGTVAVTGNLEILSGTFADGGKTVNVGGNLTINTTHSGAGAIRMTKATLPQAEISASGAGARQVQNLTIATNSGVRTLAAFNINGTLTFDNTFTQPTLDIGNNRLTFTANAGSPANANGQRFIVMSGAVAAEGVAKQFAAAPVGVTFNAPIGVTGKYTPASYTITGTGSPSLRVKAVNTKNPATQGANRTPTPINRALSYYWNIAEATGSITALQQQYTYAQADVPSGDETSYRAGYINAGLNSWIVETVPDTMSVNTTTNVITFNNRANIASDYTAGQYVSPADPREFGDIAIYYSSGATSTFNSLTSWWTTPTGPTNPTVAPSPSAAGGAARLVIQNGHSIIADQDNLQAFAVDICPTCTLDAQGFIGQVYNRVTGSGNLRIAPNTGASVANLPDADYSSFITATGGTFIFGGTAVDYTIPASLTQVRNIRVEGTGNRIIGTNMTVLGNVAVAGGNFSFGSNTLSVGGNFTHTGGTVAKSGSVVFNGTAQQTFTGIAAGTSFNNVTINNAAGMVIAPAGGNMVVDGVLTFTNGIITGNVSNAANPDAAGSVYFTANGTHTGASITSHIRGWVQKKSNGGLTFSFPTGDNGVYVDYRPIEISSASNNTWRARFFGTGYPDVDVVNAGVDQVGAAREWWRVSDTTNGGTASVRVYWGSGSMIDPAATVSNFRVGIYNTGNSRWEPSLSSPAGTTATGSVLTNGPLTFSAKDISLYSFGSPLPVEWLMFRGYMDPAGKVYLNWATASELNNSHFIVERSVDALTFTPIGRVQGNGTTNVVSNYQMLDEAAPQDQPYIYYRLKQVDFDGQSSYSPIIELDVQQRLTGDQRDRNNQWTLAPNPVVGEDLNILLTGFDVNPYDAHRVTLVSPNGNVAFVGRGTLAQVASSLRQQMSALQAGIYSLVIESGNARQNIRLVKF